jgi:endonuclease YncB( thermonuclease family)
MSFGWIRSFGFIFSFLYYRNNYILYKFNDWMRKELILIIVMGIVILFLMIILLTGGDSQVPVVGNTILVQENSVIENLGGLNMENDGELFLVTRVIDGDTIEIETEERVRLICIDTPERGEEGYIEASNYLQGLILNKEVKLVKDKSETDRYGRLVRYIYVGDLFVNEKMVAEGFALAYPYNPDTTLCPQIERAEEKAKRNGIGIWSEGEEEEQETSGDECYSNIYNCGDFSRHTEAQELFEECGGASNDVHRLDQDGDGIACEGLP